MFNWADWVTVAILILSIGYSLMRGFIREILSLIVWLLAFSIAIFFAGKLAPFMATILLHPMLQFAASFVILFIVVLIIGGLIIHFMSSIVKPGKLSITDHVLGAIFGFIRGIVVILIGLFVIQMICKTTPQWWTNSLLIPKIWFLMQFLQYGLPISLQQHIQVFK